MKQKIVPRKTRTDVAMEAYCEAFKTVIAESKDVMKRIRKIKSLTKDDAHILACRIRARVKSKNPQITNGDIKKAMAILHEVAAEHREILKRDPEVYKCFKKFILSSRFAEGH